MLRIRAVSGEDLDACDLANLLESLPAGIFVVAEWVITFYTSPVSRTEFSTFLYQLSN